MAKWIDAEWVLKCVEDSNKSAGLHIEDLRKIRKWINKAPSIDIVRCKECKWSKANGTYQWCGRLDSTARITADDYCSYGERRE